MNIDLEDKGPLILVVTVFLAVALVALHVAIR